MSVLLHRVCDVMGLAPGDRDAPTISSSSRRPVVDLGFGVELEYEQYAGTNLPSHIMPLWRIHSEGSLRDGGVEFVTNGPLYGHVLEDAIKGIMKWASKEKLSPSYRAGTHVHMDFQKATFQELLFFLQIYILLEDFLFDMFAPNRKASNFCIRWGESGSIESLNKVFSELHQADSQALSPRRVRGLFQTFPKYTALNVAPLTRFGSIEFRMLPATLDPDFLIKFIHVIGCMRKAAIRTFQETSHMRENGSFLNMMSQTSPTQFIVEQLKHPSCDDVFSSSNLASYDLWEKVEECNLLEFFETRTMTYSRTSGWSFRKHPEKEDRGPNKVFKELNKDAPKKEATPKYATYKSVSVIDNSSQQGWADELIRLSRTVERENR